ncbi:MAG: hypothetical protein JRJ49_00500 [Deltaproteobacteria bacterium]|nr:hypothetical protein [Deltaproteobacteria bacterium]
MKNEEIWVKLEEKFEGMFNEECGAALKLYDKQVVTFFADESLFKKEGDHWYLKALTGDASSNDKKHILLPVEAFETQTHWAEVPSTEIL